MYSSYEIVSRKLTWWHTHFVTAEIGLSPVRTAARLLWPVQTCQNTSRLTTEAKRSSLAQSQVTKSSQFSLPITLLSFFLREIQIKRHMCALKGGGITKVPEICHVYYLNCPWFHFSDKHLSYLIKSSIISVTKLKDRGNELTSCYSHRLRFQVCQFVWFESSQSEAHRGNSVRLFLLQQII